MSKFLASIFLAIAVFTLHYTIIEAASCTKATLPPDNNKPTVVLLHGFSGGAWHWFRVRFILESLGYNVKALDFTASGQDFNEVESFDTYHEPLERFMAGLTRHEKVVLVGHNVAGISLTKTLHRHADKVHVAVYISATMLKYGYLSCEDLQIGVPGFIQSRCNSSCPTRLPDPICFEDTLVEPLVVPLNNLLLHHTLRKSLQRPGPYRAIATSNLTADAKGSAADKVPRVYVKTRMDTVFTPAMQDAMIRRWPPCEVLEVENGHDVLFEKPDLVSALIVNATSYALVS